ncbi:MAG: STAS domain-containing protein [Proteobacteria bacterium]|nr:STAS domain-containing protein [Pseudomonadota bacterium]
MHLNQAEFIQQDQQNYSIAGMVDFTTVPGLMVKAMDICKSLKKSSSSELDIDLSKVTESNSAALALILEIAKDARANNITLRFQNLPESLLSISKAYGIENEIRELCK